MPGPITDPVATYIIYTPTANGLAASDVDFEATGQGTGNWWNEDGNDGEGEGGTYEKISPPPPDKVVYYWKTYDGSKSGWFDVSPNNKAWKWGHGKPGGTAVGPVRTRLKGTTSGGTSGSGSGTGGGGGGKSRLDRLKEIEEEIGRILREATWGTSAELAERFLQLQEERDSL